MSNSPKRFFYIFKYCVLLVLFHCHLFFTQIFFHPRHCFLHLKLSNYHTVFIIIYYMYCKSLGIYFFYCLGLSPSTTSLSTLLIYNINIFVKLSLFSSFTIQSLSHSHVRYRYIALLVKPTSVITLFYSQCMLVTCMLLLQCQSLQFFRTS
jgi:hypothetical protein